MSKRYMRAYYNTFTPTGNDAVDAILEAVALAGKAYHSTSEWGEPVEYDKPKGPCFWDLIQEAANNAAKAPQPEAVLPHRHGDSGQPVEVPPKDGLTKARACFAAMPADATYTRDQIIACLNAAEKP